MDSIKNDIFEKKKASFRNLTQYRNLSDEEFEELWSKKIIGIEVNKEFEARIARKIDEFSNDYDIDDLKANDKLVLRALAQSYIQLEDLENYAYTKRLGGIENDEIVMMEKMANVMSTLRRDISKMQDDLKITRRIRKGDKEESVVNYIENLKKKAKEFYQNSMFYIWCPKCKMLLATVWFHYPEEKGNKVHLICNRDLGDGEKCKEKLIVSSKELLENRGVSTTDVPEFFR